MDNLAAADVDGHMVNVIAAGIEQQNLRLGITDWYGLSSGSLVPGASSRTDAEMGKYALVNPEQSAPLVRLVPPYT